MREIEPREARGRLRGIAHKIMVIGPNDGDEKVAHCVAEPCGPEQQQSLKGGELWWTQFQNQHCDEDSEHAIGERAQSLRGRFMEHGHTISCALRGQRSAKSS